MFFSRDDKEKKITLPLLPLRDIVLFPHMVVPLFVGREKSIAALNAARSRKSAEEKPQIVLSAQKRAKTNDPSPDEVFHVATLGNILQLLPLPDGTMKVLVEGVRRVRIVGFQPSDTHFLVDAVEVDEAWERNIELEALLRAVGSTFRAWAELSRRVQPEIQQQVAAIDDPSRLSDIIAAQLSLKLNDKQLLLELESPVKRLEKIYELMQGEIEILKVEKKLKSRVKKQMEKNQKEYYLNEQMQAIQRELGDKDDSKGEIQEIEEKLKTKRMSKEATLKVKKELKKLRLMGPMSAEATVVRNYIDWILSLPWYDETKDHSDIVAAERVLDEDHYGLKKAKERILEYLAVQTLVQKMKGPILCFVGPPGVGKTSLGRSIARALGRKFVRLSLGGVRDEAEIRGHRRTYIGALPGKIIQSLKKAESNNPVMLLDEVDKMSTDFRGDPSAALLEVLDPEQNHTFNDHYLDLDYDLSKVMFICTANSMHTIPGPLQDRMEVIRIAGYTQDEKMSIARKYLVPKQKEANGLADLNVKVTNTAVRTIINRYTYESGVRTLERELASVFRKVARDVLKNGKRDIVVDRKHAMKLLGIPKVTPTRKEREDQIGVVTGLSVTSAGGDLLPIEVAFMPGKGKVAVTGQLSEMMKESAHAAVTYVRSRSKRFHIEDKFFENNDLHVHVPTPGPKDGNSAGVTIATAIASAAARIAVRRDVAMTGEVTLRGRVLPIGGLKEKVLAAHRAGIKTVLFPWGNRKDVKEIPRKVREAIALMPVKHVDEILKVALVLEKPELMFGTPAATSSMPADVPQSAVS